MSKPSTSEQVAFLRDLQRLPDEGQFVATYKFALILAIAELAVERGNDSGDALALPVPAIADRFVALYWGHTRPFLGLGNDGSAKTLSQNLGSNIALLRKVATMQRQRATLAEARACRQWPRLVSEATQILRDMPLFRLQTIRSGAIHFLYENSIVDGAIVLKPGVAYHFRYFQTLVQHLVRGAWVRHVRSNPRNHSMLGDALDLEEFLFGARRAQYPRLKEALRDLQRGNCFYCARPIRGHDALDHFIPWAKYPSDLGHNFVLADRRCNADKSDLLAELCFREKWEERNATESPTLSQAYAADTLPYDLAASQGIAAWTYAVATETGRSFWAPSQV